MDPFARLFCVKMDKSPIMDSYWKENEALAADELEALRNRGSGFTNAIKGVASAENTSAARGDGFY